LSGIGHDRAGVGRIVHGLAIVIDKDGSFAGKLGASMEILARFRLRKKHSVGLQDNCGAADTGCIAGHTESGNSSADGSSLFGETFLVCAKRMKRYSDAALGIPFERLPVCANAMNYQLQCLHKQRIT